MAERTPQARAAAIRRASAQARATMNEYDQELLTQLRDLYLAASERIEDDIDRAAGAGDRVALDRLYWLRFQIAQELQRLAEAWQSLLDQGLPMAAAIGSAPFSSALAQDQVDYINTQAVEFVRRFTAADGLQLSDRLWRINKGTSQRIENAIEMAIIRGDDAYRAALAGMTAAPDALGAASPGKIKGTIRELMTGRGSALYNAQRVMRTEINRAHGMAYQAGAAQTPGTVGTRFLLSPAHPEPDICDVHAAANLHGLGKGVYPHGKNPWPAHPNTLSYVVAVFEHEVSDQDKSGVETETQAQQRIMAPGAPRTPYTLDQLITLGQEVSRKLLPQAKAQYGELWPVKWPELIYQALNETVGTNTPARVASKGAGADLVVAASRLFPDSWTKAADNFGPLTAKKQDRRAFYRPGQNGAGLLAVRDFGSTVHEYAHRLQAAMPELDDYFQQLHVGRTAGDPLRRMRDLSPGYPYAASEVAREDDYIHPYMGKEYSGRNVGRAGALEVMSLSLEWMLGPNAIQRERFAEFDRELFDMTLGLLFHYAP